jgi:pilus assembly protein Flp/PilA
MMNLVNRLWKEEEGQDLVEYGLLLLLVALVAVTSMKVIGGAISNVFTSAASNLTSAT